MRCGRVLLRADRGGGSASEILLIACFLATSAGAAAYGLFESGGVERAVCHAMSPLTGHAECGPDEPVPTRAQSTDPLPSIDTARVRDIALTPDGKATPGFFFDPGTRAMSYRDKLGNITVATWDETRAGWIADYFDPALNQTVRPPGYDGRIAAGDSDVLTVSQQRVDEPTADKSTRESPLDDLDEVLQTPVSDYGYWSSDAIYDALKADPDNREVQRVAQRLVWEHRQNVLRAYEEDPWLDWFPAAYPFSGPEFSEPKLDEPITATQYSQRRNYADTMAAYPQIFRFIRWLLPGE